MQQWINDPMLNRAAACITIVVGLIQVGFWVSRLIRWYRRKGTEFKVNVSTVFLFVELAFCILLFLSGLTWLYPAVFGEPFWLLGLRLLFCLVLLICCALLLNGLWYLTFELWVYPLNKKLLDEWSAKRAENDRKN